MGDGYFVSICVKKVEQRESWREHSDGAAGNQRLSDANCSVDDTLFTVLILMRNSVCILEF